MRAVAVTGSFAFGEKPGSRSALFGCRLKERLA
jgi:hypothetical protein